MSYDSQRHCNTCGEHSPWSEECHACELLRRAEDRHDAEIRRLKLELAGLRRKTLMEVANVVGLAPFSSPSPLDGLAGLRFQEFGDTARFVSHGVCQILGEYIRGLDDGGGT